MIALNMRPLLFKNGVLFLFLMNIIHLLTYIYVNNVTFMCRVKLFLFYFLLLMLIWLKYLLCDKWMVYEARTR